MTRQLADYIGQSVRVYWNIRRKVWSVQQDGKVILHLPALTILNPVLVVSEAGRQRVLRERCKNVHAFVKGDLHSHPFIAAEGYQISYNPYRGPGFYRVGSDDPVGRWLNWAKLLPGPEVWVG